MNIVFPPKSLFTYFNSQVLDLQILLQLPDNHVYNVCISIQLVHFNNQGFKIFKQDIYSAHRLLTLGRLVSYSLDVKLNWEGTLCLKNCKIINVIASTIKIISFSTLINTLFIYIYNDFPWCLDPIARNK